MTLAPGTRLLIKAAATSALGLLISSGLQDPHNQPINQPNVIRTLFKKERKEI
jgi:hypothetical protein